jgi:hypothetical protein
VSGFAAYEGDMLRPLSPVCDEDLDLLLTGHHRHEELQDIAAFLGGLKDALAEAPGEGASRRHLAAIVQVAGEAATRGHVLDGRAPLDGSRSRRWSPVLRTRFVRVVAKALVLAVGASFLTVGLAFAGVVDLPEVADEALTKVGVILPEHVGGPETESVPSTEQLPEDANETAFAVIGAIQTYLSQVQDGTISGCEFGALVSAAATGEVADTSHCAASDDATGAQQIAGAEGGPETGDQASSGGQSVADQAEQGALEGGPETGDQASSGGESVGDEGSGGEASEGQQTSEDAASEGQSNQP